MPGILHIHKRKCRKKHNKRKHNAVKSVQNAAVTGENVSEVLDVHGAFNAACRKVTDFRKYAADDTQNDEYHARTATLSEKVTYPTGITAYKSNSRKNVTAHKTLPSNPPIAPATVFFGDIDGQSFLFPKVLPTRYANVSENTGRKIANDIANVPPHGNSLDSANASDTSAIG